MWPYILLALYSSGKSFSLSFKLFVKLNFIQWVEARKEAVTEERETLEMARRCPGCRRSMTSLTPLFGFGLTRTEEDDEDIPRRPTEGR